MATFPALFDTNVLFGFHLKIAALRFLERLWSPLPPVHRVLRVLKQIRTGGVVETGWPFPVTPDE